MYYTIMYRFKSLTYLYDLTAGLNFLYVLSACCC